MMREDAVSGVTSNPTIFAKALSGGDAYDEQIAASGGDAKSVFLALAMRDVTTACDLLRPVWEGTEGRDGYVSIEVDPNLADDTGATIAQATHFHEVGCQTPASLGSLTKREMRSAVLRPEVRVGPTPQYRELYGV
jgi:transaldolase